MADLPGIIEGAHLNRGLGHEFLAHAERTKVILYVIDGTEIIDGRNAVKDYQVLRRELELYKGGILCGKPALIALNKSDRSYTSYQRRLESLSKIIQAEESPIQMIPISAKEGTNLEVLLETMREMVQKYESEPI